VRRVLSAASIILVLSTACARHQSVSVGVKGVDRSLRTCEDVDPRCQAQRLPDITLRGTETDGALDSVDGFSLEGIISSQPSLQLDAPC
jgi:hypothetical protein